MVAFQAERIAEGNQPEQSEVFARGTERQGASGLSSRPVLQFERDPDLGPGLATGPFQNHGECADRPGVIWWEPEEGLLSPYTNSR